MSDGDIDYSKFTLRELEEALAGINRQRYPKNFANLRAAYEQTVASSSIPPPSTTSAAETVEQQEEEPGWWGKFWGSRPVLGIAGALCFWWAYDVFSHTDSCPSGRKLIADLVKVTCENLGQTAAAGIPFFIGVLALVLAIRPRIRAGA